MKKNDFLKKLLVNILDMIDFHNNQESPKSIDSMGDNFFRKSLLFQ